MHCERATQSESAMRIERAKYQEGTILSGRASPRESTI